MRKLDRKIRDAFESATPDVFTTVLSDCGKEKQTVTDLKETTHIRWKEFIAIAAMVVLLFGVGYGSAALLGSGTIPGPSVFPTESVGSTLLPTHGQIFHPTELEVRDRALAAFDISLEDVYELHIQYEDPHLICVTMNTPTHRYTYRMLVTGETPNLNIEEYKDPDANYIPISKKTAINLALSDAGISREMLTSLDTEFHEKSGLYSDYEIWFTASSLTYHYYVSERGTIYFKSSDCTAPDGERLDQQAINAALKYNDLTKDQIQDLTWSLDHDENKNYYYTIQFYHSFYAFECRVNAFDISDILYNHSSPVNTGWIPATYPLSAFDVARIDANVDISELVYLEIDAEGSEQNYSVVFKTNDYVYIYDIRHGTGKILNKSVTANISEHFQTDGCLTLMDAIELIRGAEGINANQISNLDVRRSAGYCSVSFGKNLTYHVDISNGTILKVSSLTLPTGILNQWGAVNLALKQAGLSIEQISGLDCANADIGYMTVRFYADGHAYEILVNCASGGSVVSMTKTPATNIGPGYIEPLDDAVDRNIREHYISLFRKCGDSSHTADDVSLRFYGAYDDAYAMFIDDNRAYAQPMETDVIAGLSFVYGSTQHLRIYHEGYFYSISAAYALDILKYDELVNLYLYYRSQHPYYYTN